MQETQQHAIATYVSDMLAVAQHVAMPLDAQVNDESVAAIPEAATVITKIKTVVDRQVERLNAHLDQVGGHPASSVKNAVSSILGSAAATIDKARKTKVSKMVRDDQTALTMMTVSYSLLHTTALGLDDAQTANLSQRCLEELTPLVMELSRCIPAVVISELRADGMPVNTAAIEAAREDIQKAWH